MTLFRRKWGTDVWHLWPGCPDWPAPMESKEREHRPPNGALCEECLAKRHVTGTPDL